MGAPFSIPGRLHDGNRRGHRRQLILREKAGDIMGEFRYVFIVPSWDFSCESGAMTISRRLIVFQVGTEELENDVDESGDMSICH